MKKCFECEATEDLQEHHVVPKSKGGSKTITLCYECHMKTHGRDGKGLNHKRLTKEGIARAKARGVKLGNRTNLKEAQQNGHKSVTYKANKFALTMAPFVMNGASHSEMARQLNAIGKVTQRGKEWTPMGVSRLRKRIKTIKENK